MATQEGGGGVTTAAVVMETARASPVVFQNGAFQGKKYGFLRLEVGTNHKVLFVSTQKTIKFTKQPKNLSFIFEKAMKTINCEIK